MSDPRFYGGDGTWHDTESLDVETDVFGNVVAVWFRCQPLPFRQDKEIWGGRAKEMREMYEKGSVPKLVGVTVLDG